MFSTCIAKSTDGVNDNLVGFVGAFTPAAHSLIYIHASMKSMLLSCADVLFGATALY